MTSDRSLSRIAARVLVEDAAQPRAVSAEARKNAIVVLMSIEIMLNAANINLVAFSRYHTILHPLAAKDATGQVFALFSIAIAAAEVAVGLAILLTVYRRYQTIDVDKINILRW